MTEPIKISQKPSKISEMSISELEEQIRHHNDLYFKKASPVISDYDFDRMVERLRQLNPQSSLLQEIGSDLTSGSKKVEHSSPMLSLDKCYNVEDLRDWAQKFEGLVTASPKIDGLAIAIRYNKHGHLEVAETRGDGFKGEDITENLKRVSDVPLKIPESWLEVRGEIYMPKTIFKRYEGQFANPRNLAAGALKQKDPEKTAEYQLRFFAYDLLGLSLESEKQKHEVLSRFHFPLVETHWVEKSEEALQKIYDHFLALREKVEYEMDGVVYRVDSIAEQTRLGASSHHPRWAIAYKFQGDSGTSILKDIEWSVSRTGAITPIGLIEPVKLSGAMVSRVSMHNVGLMQKTGATLGAKVLVMRRGGVIPNLEQVLEKGPQEIEIPQQCPSCHFATEIRDDFLFCTNPKGCRQTKLKELKHFVDVLEIDNIGDKLIGQLYDNGFVEEMEDFYRLREEDLLNLERMGDILAKKIIRNIQSRKKIPLPQFLQALGIDELAKQASHILVKKYRNLGNILSAPVEELEKLENIGPIISQSIVNGLQKKQDRIQALLKQVQLDEKTTAKEGKLSGQSFLFTGKMAALSRDEAEKKVEEAGGEIASGVSRDLDFLVIGSEGYKNQDKGQKWIKAEALIQKGAPLKIISEDDFLKLL